MDITSPGIEAELSWLITLVTLEEEEAALSCVLALNVVCPEVPPIPPLDVAVLIDFDATTVPLPSVLEYESTVSSGRRAMSFVDVKVGLITAEGGSDRLSNAEEVKKISVFSSTETAAESGHQVVYFVTASPILVVTVEIMADETVPVQR